MGAANHAPIRLVVGGAEASPASGGPSGDVTESEIVLFTSGTTGAPKRVRIPLAKRIGKRGAGRPARWLRTYSPTRWAGVSVMAHAHRTGGVVVPDSLEPAAILAAARADGATHISMTPSLFRKLQLSEGSAVLSGLKVEQLAFGGEAVSQGSLDAARSVWPMAKLSHVYGSTEFGDILSVSDGLAGVPCSKFDRIPFSFADGGELLIDGVPTGDYWELADERYRFVGRKGEIINVGGAKVSPLSVEEVALSVSGVRAARAFGIANPLLGQAVALEFVGELTERDLKTQMATRLPKIAIPMVITRVGDIELTAAGKTSRKAR